MPDAPEGLITEAEQARRLNVTLRTLRRWRAAGYGPKAVRIGGRWAYTPQAGPEWLAAQERAVELPAPRRRRAA